MPFHGQAQQLLDVLRAIHEGIEALDVGERDALLLHARALRDLLESVKRRGEAAESAHARSGAPLPRGRRLA